MCCDALYICCICKFAEECEFAFDGYNYDVKNILDCLASKQEADEAMKDRWMWYKFVRYEYKCPHCGHINVRYERCARIVCSKCGKPFCGEVIQ